ncbi:hypothetical protein SEA_ONEDIRECTION_55 [Gordonia phage OneDirection]|nr:hypothetical protein SEA_ONEDIRECTION_55 [Gordonia phage OneDirection]
MSDIGFGPVGDPPIIYDTFTTDDYGRKTPLVDRRLLEQAEVRIAEVGVFARSLLGDQVDGDTPGLDSESEGIVVAHSHLIGRRIQDIIDGKHSPIVVPESRNACSIVDDILERQDGEGSHNAARRVVAERDHWRAEAEKARTPDANNPEHLRSVADLLERVINVRRSPNTCPDLRAAADRLESEATADDVVEPYSRDGYNAAQRIENAAREIAKTRGWDWINGPLHHREACWRDARALHSAGLLRGGS